MTTLSTEDQVKARIESEILYQLYNLYGRGKISEWDFVFLYIGGKLPDFIKKGAKENVSVFEEAQGKREV